MTAPTLQGEGAIAAVTTGDLTVTLPAHAADDILVLCALLWAPATAGDLAGFGNPTGWGTVAYDVFYTAAVIDGRYDVWWKRAASGAEANPTVGRPAGADTGADTCFAGRAYTIRGCDKILSPPWDEIDDSASDSIGVNTANGAFAAMTVNGRDRLVVQFLGSADNQAAGAAPAGWTAGTAVTTATGTDAGFQTFRKVTDANTAADASSTAAPAQGFYDYIGISFKPQESLIIQPEPLRGLVAR